MTNAEAVVLLGIPLTVVGIIITLYLYKKYRTYRICKEVDKHNAKRFK